MRREVVLITGASGEVGHDLITHLSQRGSVDIIGLDIKPLSDDLRRRCYEFIQGDILDKTVLGRIVLRYEIQSIFHLATILSTSAEFNPQGAHRVNVDGTLKHLNLAVEQSRWQGRSIKFIYPSSIATYGLPNLETKDSAGKIMEDQFCQPFTMYGCNKLYCEHLGRYYAEHYQQLAADHEPYSIDFRSIRFPGLISAVTIPVGGTTDFGPEMVHHAAQGKAYPCFVREDTRLPFMVMPDAIKALTSLEAADHGTLSRHVYNATSFSVSAGQFLQRVKDAFSNAQVTFEPDQARQKIVDSWPGDLDDSDARRDWGWMPEYDIDQAFNQYLIPTIRDKYQK